MDLSSPGVLVADLLDGVVSASVVLRSQAHPHADVSVFLDDPRASEIVARSAGMRREIASVRARGPKVTLRLSDEYVTALGTALEAGAAPSLDGSRRYRPHLVSYLGANLSKPLHLGHLRNVVVGHALASAFAATGTPTATYSVVGDIGRNVCEAMAGYDMFHRDATPETLGVKSDHLVGTCYSAYLGVVTPMGGDGGDPVDREYVAIGDRADALLDGWRRGDPDVVTLWRRICEYAQRGHEATLADLGVVLGGYRTESAATRRADELVDRALTAGVAERIPDGRVVYVTGREELATVVLRRSDGFPTEHARIVAVFEDVLGRAGDAVNIEINGTDWFPGQTVLGELMCRLGIMPSGVEHRPIYHGLVLANETQLSSSGADPVLADDVVAALRASREVAAIDGVPAPVVADVVLKVFLLTTPILRSVTYSWPRLVNPSANPAWGVARAWAASVSGGDRIARDDAAYRLAVLRAHALPGAVEDTLDRLDPSLLTRFVVQLAGGDLLDASDDRVHRILRTVLATAFDVLGVCC